MPGISFFADSKDGDVLIDRLNRDPEIAFLVPDGPLDPQEAYANRLRASMGDRTEAVFYGPFGVIDDGYRQRWKAVPSVKELSDGKHLLWHVPAGPLPLLSAEGADGVIPDPWAGWMEQRPGADPTTPYFGPGHPAVIGLELWTRHHPYSAQERASLPIVNSWWDGERDLLVVSDLGWIGGHYGPPPVQTRRWWNRLKAWFGRSAAKLADGRQTFWTLPSALQLLKAGTEYYCRGFDLSASISSAEVSLRSPEVRDLFPPGPVGIDPAWLRWKGGTLFSIARRIYQERAYHEMPILADALEEAGCQDQDILDHCRSGNEHVRACWVIAALLSKS